MLTVAHLDERIEKLLSILADNPHSQVFAALADAYRKRGDLGRAFAVCKGGLKHHPNYAPAHLVLAKLYLHQGMHAEAYSALQEAIRLDGPTRGTDLVEAEIRLGMGDLEGARRVIDRLRAADRRDPVIKDLVVRLKVMRGNAAGAAPKAPEAAPVTRVAESVRPVQTAAQLQTWGDWAREIGRLPHVERAFVFLAPGSDCLEGDVLAQTQDSGRSRSLAECCAVLYGAVDAAVRRAGAGALSELRIERPDGEIWCRRDNACVVGFAVRAGASFGALRQAALDAAMNVNRETQVTPITPSDEGR